MKKALILISVVFVLSIAANAFLWANVSRLTEENQQLRDKSDKAFLDNDSNLKAMAKMKENFTARENDLNSELDAAHSQIAKLTPDAQRGRTLPIKVSVRTAWTDNTYVLQMRNTSGESIPVKVTFSNATLGSKTFTRILPGGPVPALIEIGTMEGWKGLRGDQIEISSDGYDTLKTHF